MIDRLIEIVVKAKEEYANDVTDHTEAEYIVESLLNNGVVVPPCKVGTDLYLPDYPNMHCRLKEYKFCGDRIAIVIDCWEWQRTCTRWLDDFGKTVFLSREEAEAKLKEGAE